MKILTTNSAGSDRFGGIHTRKIEHIKNSPQNTFHILELNKEKKYLVENNHHIHKIDVPQLTKGKGIFEILNNSKNYSDFNVKVERMVNEFQNVIRSVEPNVILIPGTSLTSFFLYKACRREGVLNKTIQEYVGVLEKEIGNYSGDTRYILGQIGKVFVSETALENVTYMFPSQICKKTVEEIHNVKIKNGNIIWNGISEEFIQGEFNRNVPKDLTLGYVGRIHHVKNLPFFLGLDENLKRTPKLKIITDISCAGAKPTGKPLLEKMTDGKVLYYSPRPRKELKEFYQTQISAGVVSSFFETYCNGALESLVCGTPTLLSNKAGASEVYKKYGLDDLVFSIDDISSFEKALGVAENMNFTIPQELSKEIYSDLCWKKVIGKYNKLNEIVASKNKH